MGTDVLNHLVRVQDGITIAKMFGETSILVQNITCQTNIEQTRNEIINETKDEEMVL